jgi:hypothetical protein
VATNPRLNYRPNGILFLFKHGERTNTIDGRSYRSRGASSLPRAPPRRVVTSRRSCTFPSGRPLHPTTLLKGNRVVPRSKIGPSMSQMGHDEKNLRRAFVFRITSDSCRTRAVPALTFSTRSGHSPTSAE